MMKSSLQVETDDTQTRYNGEKSKTNPLINRLMEKVQQ